MKENKDQIGFNKPYLTGKELDYITNAVELRKLSGNGLYTGKCQNFFEGQYGFKKCLLTTSCTDALEMCALLLDIKEGDEVILPSFTFVSTANAFVLRGARIVFCDSSEEHPNISPSEISKLITPKTKAIVVVHYAGVACDMDEIMNLANKHGVYVVEDAAQAIDSYYKGRPLGSIGHLAAMSFHETKNIISGEGGMLIVNDEQFINRSEIIWEKGTNRSAFFRGETDKYNWVDIGSSFLPSEINAAFLYAQLEALRVIQEKRISLYQEYFEQLNVLQESNIIGLPSIPHYATNNGHMFYVICKNLSDRNKLIAFLKSHQVMAVFHYLSLNASPFYLKNNKYKKLKWSDYYSDCILRLPMYYDLKLTEVGRVCELIKRYYC